MKKRESIPAEKRPFYTPPPPKLSNSEIFVPQQKAAPNTANPARDDNSARPMEGKIRAPPE